MNECVVALHYFYVRAVICTNKWEGKGNGKWGFFVVEKYNTHE